MKKMKELFPHGKVEEYVSAVIIFTAILLCILLSYLGYLQSQQAVKFAVEVAVAPASSPESQSVEVYTQLEDPLLVLVNDQVPLPEDWSVIPAMIGEEQVDQKMYRDLSAMFDAGAKEKIWFWVASGYRSVEEQTVILNRAIEENRMLGMGEREAREEALKTIARPGYSEHHTGLVVDLNDVSDDFETTEAYKWLSSHGAEYGFVQRYKAEKSKITGIDNESWHYRYVGRKHAKEMERLDMCLEEYVLYLKKRGVK